MAIILGIVVAWGCFIAGVILFFLFIDFVVDPIFEWFCELDYRRYLRRNAKAWDRRHKQICPPDSDAGFGDLMRYYNREKERENMRKAKNKSRGMHIEISKEYFLQVIGKSYDNVIFEDYGYKDLGDFCHNAKIAHLNYDLLTRKIQIDILNRELSKKPKVEEKII